MAELSKLGRYELRRILGKGAMGVVYEGYDPTLGRRVAVKTILKSIAFDAETERNYAERFVREAKAVARLNHANIVQVHDFGVENEVAYLVMEFIQGRELRSHFLAGERFDTAECVRIMGELLDALDFAHEAGVIHRDVKPANVMLDAQRRVKLADFGVARVQDSDRSAAGTMVGTPAFMSPEQISGGKIDRRTDIFSAGTILYQLLTGEQPFKGDGAWTVAKQIMQDHPPHPSSVVQSVSPAFDGLVARALAKKPNERYASAREFGAALRGAQAPGAQSPAAAMPKSRPRAEPKASDTELEFWRAVQNSDDPAELEVYLEEFSQGTYAQLARLKIAKLRAPIEAARKAAEEKARAEAEDKARLEAETQARGAPEKTEREAAERSKREAEEKVRQAQALAQPRQKEEMAARPAKAAKDDDATVAIGDGRPGAAPSPGQRPARASSYLYPAAVVALVIASGIGAYLYMGPKPAPAPVAQKLSAPKVAAQAPAPEPPKTEISAAELEKIRKETEERVRREYADKTAAERAVMAKSATEKAVHEKQTALKAAAEKVMAERVAAAERAVAAAEKMAAAERSARVAAEQAAAERAAAERTAAAREAELKAAAARAAEEKALISKAAPLIVAPPPRRGLAGRYVFHFQAGTSGSSAYCDRFEFQEDLEIKGSGTDGVNGKDFYNLRFQSARDEAVAATFWGSRGTNVNLTGRATSTGYAGTYFLQGGSGDGKGGVGTCSGGWTMVRKGG